MVMLIIQYHLILFGLILTTFLITETLHGTTKDMKNFNLLYQHYIMQECTMFQLLMLVLQSEKTTLLTKKELKKISLLR